MLPNYPQADGVDFLLQKLKTVVAGKDAQIVAACLPPWAYVYNKLVMDSNR